MLIVHRDKEDKPIVRCPVCKSLVGAYVPTDKIQPNDIRIKGHAYKAKPCKGSGLSVLDSEEPIL